MDAYPSEQSLNFEMFAMSHGYSCQCHGHGQLLCDISLTGASANKKLFGQWAAEEALYWK